jgi:hypothetical protein
MCNNGSTIPSKLENEHLSGLSTTLFARHEASDFCLFNLLKGTLKGRAFALSEEIEAAIMMVEHAITFADVQGVFHNTMSRLASVIEIEGEITLGSKRLGFVLCSDSRDRTRDGDVVSLAALVV